MDFTQAIAAAMGKYFTFSGRATRPEYWWFFLFTVLMIWGASIVEATGSQGDSWLMSAAVSLIFTIPQISCATRRLHDTGRSGWWQLLSLVPLIGWIILIIWLARKGEAGENRFGPAAG
ncbi:DUF805 domain-containing protein [Pseudoroseomonas cervicalis]|uniref:DUF805 domain-containing protein n=1 Tax=Teichococcus cervicalis TaxID=204525 RepID=UPI0022F17BCD|nr:DUF805 domain-containing protein [Pseudoroseomonas cervicalis]WBV41886.1 DUF805 domain-containing protein [Pseudoroseomonas cervicalis]